MKKRKRFVVKPGKRMVRVDKETHAKLRSFSRELSAMQDANISMGEAIRRLSRMPNCRAILEKDAKIKRRLRR